MYTNNYKDNFLFFRMPKNKIVFRDASRNVIKRGFYFDLEDAMPQRAIYFFEKQVKMGVNGKIEGWTGYCDGRDGQKEFFTEDTHEYVRASTEDVKARILYLRQRATNLEKELLKQ